MLPVMKASVSVYNSYFYYISEYNYIVLSELSLGNYEELVKVYYTIEKVDLFYSSLE